VPNSLSNVYLCYYYFLQERFLRVAPENSVSTEFCSWTARSTGISLTTTLPTRIARRSTNARGVSLKTGFQNVVTPTATLLVGLGLLLLLLLLMSLFTPKQDTVRVDRRRRFQRKTEKPTN